LKVVSLRAGKVFFLFGIDILIVNSVKTRLMSKSCHEIMLLWFSRGYIGKGVLVRVLSHKKLFFLHVKYT